MKKNSYNTIIMYLIKIIISDFLNFVFIYFKNYAYYQHLMVHKERKQKKNCPMKDCKSDKKLKGVQ